MLIAGVGALTSEAQDRIALERLINVKTADDIRRIRAEFSDGKCGFGFSTELMQQAQQLLGRQAVDVRNTFRMKVFQADTVIGHFRIHFDSSGIDTPSLLDVNNNPIPNTAKAYVDSVGRILNDVWSIEINDLGYLQPPFETGNSSYNVYIEDMNEYGFTQPVEQLNPGKTPPLYTSYIGIDNDFRELEPIYYTRGMNALKVTCAHEFHHAIQVGSYGQWPNHVFFHELTSTWMEEYIYPEVNDHLHFDSTFFQIFNIGTVPKSFVTPTAGYERAAWGVYLQKQFGPSLMREIWEAYALQPFLSASIQVFRNHGTSFEQEYFLFSTWTYFTADRANIVRYFPQGNTYPRLAPLVTAELVGTIATISNQMPPLAAGLYQFRRGADTINALLVNTDVSTLLRNDQSYRGFSVQLGMREVSGATQALSNGLNVGVTVSDPNQWREAYFLLAQNLVSSTSLSPSPNPFRISDGYDLLLPISESGPTPTDISIITLAGDLRLEKRYAVRDLAGQSVVTIPARDLQSCVASGVHLIIARTSSREYVWKIAIIQ